MRRGRVAVLAFLTVLAGAYAFDFSALRRLTAAAPSHRPSEVGFTSTRQLHRTFFNNRSQVVGLSRMEGEWRRFFWDPNKGFSLLPNEPFEDLFPTGITSSGAVYGFALTGKVQPAQPYIDSPTSPLSRVWPHFESKNQSAQAFIWNPTEGIVFPASGEITNSVIETMNGKGQAVLASLEQVAPKVWRKNSYLWDHASGVRPIHLETPEDALVSITHLSDAGELAGEWIWTTTDPQVVVGTPCLPTRIWQVFVNEGTPYELPVNGELFLVGRSMTSPPYLAQLRAQFYWSESTRLVEIPAAPTERFQFFMWKSDGEIIGFRGKGVGAVASWKPEQKLQVTTIRTIDRIYRKLMVNRSGEFAVEYAVAAGSWSDDLVVLKPIKAWWARFRNLVTRRPPRPPVGEFAKHETEAVIDLDATTDGLKDWTGVELLGLNDKGEILICAPQFSDGGQTYGGRRRNALYVLRPAASAAVESTVAKP